MLENRPGRLWPAGSVGMTDKDTKRERENIQRETKEDPPKKQRKTITLTYRANTEGKRKFAPS